MKKSQSFFDTFLTCLKSLMYFGIYYVVASLVSAIILLIAELFGKELPSSLVMIPSYIIVVLCFVVMLIPKGESIFEKADIKLTKVRYIICGALFGVGFFGLYLAFATLFEMIPWDWVQKIVDMQKTQAGGQLEGPMVLNVIYVGLIAPVCEELVFRGLMLKSLKGNFPKWASILVCALCFGAIHLPSPIAFVVTTALGALLGIIFYRTSSLIPCVLAHILFNVSNFLLFIPNSIGFYILLAISIPSLIYSVIEFARRQK